MARATAPGPANVNTSAAKPRARSVVLIIDADQVRRDELRRVLHADGYAEPLVAVSGDDALDVLGVLAQRVDLIIAWVPLIDEGKLDFLGVLRGLSSPVRVAAATPLTCERYPNAKKLAGVTAVLFQPSFKTFAAQADILIQSGRSVGHIVATRRVPRLLPDAWAKAIYGAPAGAATGPLA